MKPGDVCYHKATEEKCVIAEPWNDSQVRVTTQKGDSKVYYRAELWSEVEWLEKNKNKV